MHRCLHIEEVIRNVAASLRTDDMESHRDTLPTLASMAVTCHSFKEVALDQLWYKLYESILPLVMLFPKDSWEFRRLYNGEQEFHFTRVLHANDWTRFTYYAKKIRNIEHIDETYSSSRSISSISTSAFLALSLHRPTPILLPNLIKLRWCDARVDSLPFIHLFLTRQLVTLRLMPTGTMVIWDDRAKQLIAALPIDCPKLRKLVVTNWPCRQFSSALLPPVQAQRLSHNASLKDITLRDQPISRETLIYLAALPQLESACFAYVDHHVLDLDTSLGQIQIFPSLQTLDLIVLHISPLFELLHSLSPFKLLTSISLSIERGFSPSNIQKLFAAIGQLSSLQTLCVCISGKRLRSSFEDLSAWGPLGRLTLSQITPVFSLRNLRILSIRTPSFILDDPLLDAVARNMPNLVSIDLGSNSEPLFQPTQVTLQGLLPLARHCLSLELLSVPIDTSITTSSPSNGADIISTLLTRLHVRDSSAAQPARIAEFLAKHFTALSCISRDSGRSGSDGQQDQIRRRQWREVNREFVKIIPRDWDDEDSYVDTD
ncbi:hypothetical protein HGRIS_006075 [Hohenbuehelia grisea]|uniref:F-box domain-containing protein n=1 Tax=Hohenbuehelia grisea TaxID=104357 RepID=A0ABR3K1B3_9AGAR